MKRLLILLLTGLFAQLVVSCYPEGADNIEDYDVAITNYDKGADFSAFTTFSIPDTVVYFANDNSASKPSHEFDDAVIKAVTDNFVAMGYEKVADPTATTPAEDLPSFIVTVSAFLMSTMLISLTTGTTTGIGTGVAGGVVLSILTILGIRLVFTLTEQVLWWWKWFLRLNGMTIK